MNMSSRLYTGVVATAKVEEGVVAASNVEDSSETKTRWIFSSTCVYLSLGKCSKTPVTEKFR